MLHSSDIYKTDKVLKGLESGLNTIVWQRKSDKNDAIAKGVEAFVDCFTGQGIKAKITPYYGRSLFERSEGYYLEDFFYEGELCNTLTAIVPLDLGSLTYNVSFVKSVDYTTEDWERVKGTGEIEAIITTAININAGHRFKEGRLTGFASLQDNLSNISLVLNEVVSKVSEDILRNAASEHLSEINKSIESYNTLVKGMQELIDKRRDTIYAEYMSMADTHSKKLTEAITDGITREEFDALIDGYEVYAKVNENGDVEILTEGYEYRAVNRNEILNLFSYDETTAVRIEKPKRKNSKHQDVYRRYKNSNDEVNTSMIECDTVKRGIYNLANHMAAVDLMKRDGVFNVVESVEK